MLNSDGIADLIGELVEARVVGDEPALVDLLDGLVTGEVVDGLNVTLVMAGLLAEGFEGEPEGGFHRVTVTHVGVDGVQREGSAEQLPPHVAVFAQMVAAIANKDRSMAVDLFAGFVGDDGMRALALLVFGLNEVVHMEWECPQCPASGPEATS